jgi:hypothetical protein
MHRVNWWAIAVSAIVFFIIGSLWYGLLFGNAWLAAIGKTQAQLAAGGVTAYPYVVAILMAFFLAYGVARVLSWRGSVSIAEGAFIGLSLGLLIFGTMTWMDYAYEMRGIVLGLINVGYVVVGMAVMGAILAAWKPKAS